MTPAPSRASPLSLALSATTCTLTPPTPLTLTPTTIFTLTHSFN